MKLTQKRMEIIFVEWIAFACAFIRNSSLKNIGIFNEKYFVYGEDSDWCWRARKLNFKIAYLPFISIIHEVGASSVNKAHLNPNWFINLSKTIFDNGSKYDYYLFLIISLISFAIRFLIFYFIKFFYKKYTIYTKLCFLLYKTSFKLLFKLTI